MGLFIFSCVLLTIGLMVLIIDDDKSFGAIMLVGSSIFFIASRMKTNDSEIYVLKKYQYEVIGSKTNSMYIIRYKEKNYPISDYRNVMKLRDGDYKIKLKVDRSFYGNVINREIIVK
jgi:hypothetical protein